MKEKDNSTVINMIKQTILDKYGNQRNFCKQTGYSETKLSRILTTQRELNPTKIIELEKALKVQPGTILMPEQNANYIQGFNEDKKQYAIDSYEVEKYKWNVKNLRVIKMKDYSLTPDIPENSNVVIDINDKKIKDGKLYAIQIGDDVAIRRISKILGRNLYEVKSDILDFSVQHVTPEELIILGKAIYLLGKKID